MAKAEKVPVLNSRLGAVHWPPLPGSKDKIVLPGRKVTHVDAAHVERLRAEYSGIAGLFKDGSLSISDVEPPEDKRTMVNADDRVISAQHPPENDQGRGAFKAIAAAGQALSEIARPRRVE
jgi:hypothetical protein